MHRVRVFVSLEVLISFLKRKAASMLKCSMIAFISYHGASGNLIVCLSGLRWVRPIHHCVLRTRLHKVDYFLKLPPNICLYLVEVKTV